LAQQAWPIGVSIPWLLTEVNVFFPKPIHSGGSDYDCHDRNPAGPSCVNEVKVDKSAATYGDQCQRHDQVYYAVKRSHKIKFDRANLRVKGLCVSNCPPLVFDGERLRRCPRLTRAGGSGAQAWAIISAAATAQTATVWRVRLTQPQRLQDQTNPFSWPSQSLTAARRN
jgi:hypothetical protein